jgi:hypothetical protein
MFRLKHWIDRGVYGQKRPEQTESGPKRHEEFLAPAHPLHRCCARRGAAKGVAQAPATVGRCARVCVCAASHFGTVERDR